MAASSYRYQTTRSNLDEALRTQGSNETLTSAYTNEIPSLLRSHAWMSTKLIVSSTIGGRRLGTASAWRSVS